MLEITGFQLDGHHILAELEDKNGVRTWWLLTFDNEIVNGVVNCDATQVNGNLYSMQQINLDTFKWKDHNVCIVKE